MSHTVFLISRSTRNAKLSSTYHFPYISLKVKNEKTSRFSFSWHILVVRNEKRKMQKRRSCFVFRYFVSPLPSELTFWQAAFLGDVLRTTSKKWTCGFMYVVKL